MLLESRCEIFLRKGAIGFDYEDRTKGYENVQMLRRKF